MNRKLFIKLAAAAAAAALLAGCGEKTASDPAKTADAGKAAPADAQKQADAPQIIIYSNGDEEAIVAMKNALDANGFKGKYLMQTFGTSELGGKLVAEGAKIEADVVTLSAHYLASLQQQKHMFQKLAFPLETLEPCPDFYAPIDATSGALIINTEVVKQDKLPVPAAIEDLAQPLYAGHISVPDIMGSNTAWLMTQAVLADKGEAEGAKIVRAIEKNAGPHLEMSGSGPLKKVRAGEVAVAFGLRHQAVADKAKGLPIDYVDPREGTYSLVEAAAVVDKGDKTNPMAQKAVEAIIKFGRPELLKCYPVALYKGEEVDAVYKPANPKSYPEPLTLELLQKHQKLVKEAQ